MKIIGCLGAMAALALLASCQTPSERTRSEINAAVLQDDVEHPFGYRLIDGLEVWIPEGTGLSIYRRRRRYLLLGKKTGPGTSIAAVLALLTTSHIDANTPEQFAEYIRSNLLQEFQMHGEVLAFRTELNQFRGQYCAQSHIRLKIHDEAGNEKYEGRYFENWYTLMCLHPDDKTRLYRISYSERIRRMEESPTLYTEASSFFSNIRFIKPFTYKPSR